MANQFDRTTIVHEGYDIAYTLLWEALISGTIDDVARKRGYNKQDIARIHKQAQKITLRLRDRAHDFLHRTQSEEEEGHEQQSTTL